VVVVGVVVDGGVGAGGTTLPAGVVVLGVEVVGAVGVVVVGTSAPCLPAVVGAAGVVAPESGVDGALDTCGVNGFFVSKTLNDTSCPVPDGGGTSVFTSSPDFAVGALVPPATFGRTLLGPGSYVEPGGGFLFITAIIEGISYAATAINSTTPTIAAIFVRFSRCLARSTRFFFEAIYGVAPAAVAPDGGVAVSVDVVVVVVVVVVGVVVVVAAPGVAAAGAAGAPDPYT